MASTACDDQFAPETEPRPTVPVCARTHTSDQVLTGNYLQFDSERLEKECRLARERGKAVCVWKRQGEYSETLIPACLGYPAYHQESFIFCPFCGKQIKVKA
jgi:hypothetical protein